MKYVFNLINIILLSVLLQIGYFFLLLIGLNLLSPYIYYTLSALGIFAAFFIATGSDNAVYRLAWIIPVLLFPSIFGAVYFFYNRRKDGREVESDILNAGKRAASFLKKDDAELNERCSLTANYISGITGFTPAFADTVYFPDGAEFYAAFLEVIKKAERYVFIEIFTIEQGLMWNGILSVLTEKARQGVDIRIIYDGMGSSYSLPYGYYKKLRKLGIKCVVFNPFRLFFSARFNTSNHRKILSVDGNTAFIGGINFADEYINKKPDAKTGFWKDSAVMIKGGAAWNVTLMFLIMWEFISRQKPDYAKLIPINNNSEKIKSETALSPWYDIPLDSEPFSQRLYMSLITRAKRYVYIMTPYLIPPDEILSALCVQAQCGVDVRIILPFIPDKYTVHTITKTFYSGLLETGVKIYEYAPGFIHSKVIISDDEIASLGSLNLDFRSFYMHYECGVCIYGKKAVSEIHSDFIKTLSSCKEIKLSDVRKTKFFRRFFRRLCKIMMPFY